MPRPVRHVAVSGLAGALLLAAACATKSDVQRLERSMVERIQELEGQQRALLDRIGLAFDSLGEQERRELTGRGELQRQFDELGNLLAQILDLASQNNRLLSELRGSGVAVGPQAGGVGRPLPGGARGAPGAGAEEGAGDEATAFYNAALGQYRRGAYETARAGFEDFLENYAAHDLAPDAQYWLAETYVSEGNRDRALRELGRVWEGWPDSPRAARALYRSGVLEVERGRISDARVFFQRVVAGYPNSDEAPLAQAQLDRLRR